MGWRPAFELGRLSWLPSYGEEFLRESCSAVEVNVSREQLFLLLSGTFAFQPNNLNHCPPYRLICGVIDFRIRSILKIIFFFIFYNYLII